MKTITIGRDEQSDIFIRDDSNVISRNHAILRIEKNGNMTITDLSTNGTFINGIRIESNTQVPVSRKDDVSFAYIQNLDWSIIPNVKKKFLLTIMGACLAAILGIGLVLFFVFNNGNKPISTSAPVSQTDTIKDINDEQNLPDTTQNIGNGEVNDSILEKPNESNLEKPKYEKESSDKKKKNEQLPSSNGDEKESVPDAII